MASVVFLSLGSNRGDRENFLSQARKALEGTEEIRILSISKVIDNPALLYEKQADFLNQVIKLESALSPWDLLKKLKSIEKQLGRRPSFRYGPREIDLDILSYENFSSQKKELTLPHPALSSRPYLRELLEDLGTSPEELLGPYS